MTDASDAILRRHFPDRQADHFQPMAIGATAADNDAGARSILAGRKTLTSSAIWEWSEDAHPFGGALSVLLDGRGKARAIVETTAVELRPIGAFSEEHAWAYGEGERTLAWWRRETLPRYARLARENGHTLSEETLLYLEWFTVIERL